MNEKPEPTPRGAFSFPDWAARLRADGSLTPGLRESYRQTLARFLEFCQQRQAGSTVAVARDFVELERLERARQRVLGKLGWRVHRVWSTNWWHFEEQEKHAIVEAISAAREAAQPKTQARR